MGIPNAGPAAPAEPFAWTGDAVGCLLVHGLTGTPYEMRELGERLHRDGRSVVGVRLAGHGTSVEALERSRWQDWYASAADGLERLRGCDAVVVIGLSLGSLLALRLAALEAEVVRGVVALATALRLANPWPRRLEWLLSPVLPLLPRRWRFVSKSESDICDPQARAIHPGYRAIPLRSVLELLALQREVRALLPAVAQPALAMHGARDRTTDPGNLAILQRALPRLVEAVLLPESGHVITVDRERDRVAERVAAFVEAVGLGARGTPARPGRTAPGTGR